MQQMASVYAQAILNRRPADTSPAWLEWAQEELAEFHRFTEHAEFRSSDGLEIHYALFENRELALTPPSEADPLNSPTDQFVASLAGESAVLDVASRGWVLLLPGRVESYLKYQELVLELVAAGYSVAMIDHRGQGHSSRLTAHHQQGHVQQFLDYARDIAEWIQLLEHRIGTQPAYFVAHSMGGAIAALYLQHYAQDSQFPFAPVKRAVFSAPMCGIQTRPFPFWVAKPLTQMLAQINAIVSPKRQWYAPTTGDYVKLPFAENLLTHSEHRYAWFSQMYEDYQRIKVGGPTNHWVAQAIASAAGIVQQAGRIQIPILLLQGTEDQIVDSQAQIRFMENTTHPASKLVPIAGAYHEILMERDSIREPAVKLLLKFLNAN